MSLSLRTSTFCAALWCGLSIPTIHSRAFVTFVSQKLKKRTTRFQNQHTGYLISSLTGPEWSDPEQKMSLNTYIKNVSSVVRHFSQVDVQALQVCCNVSVYNPNQMHNMHSEYSNRNRTCRDFLTESFLLDKKDSVAQRNTLRNHNTFWFPARLDFGFRSCP